MHQDWYVFFLAAHYCFEKCLSFWVVVGFIASCKVASSLNCLPWRSYFPWVQLHMSSSNPSIPHFPTPWLHICTPGEMFSVCKGLITSLACKVYIYTHSFCYTSFVMYRTQPCGCFVTIFRKPSWPILYRPEMMDVLEKSGHAFCLQKLLYKMHY